VSAPLTSLAAERALDAYGTRGPDDGPVCPGCRCGSDPSRDDDLCADCGASADLHDEAADDAVLAAALARDDEYLRWCTTQRDAAIAAMDAGAPL